MKKYFISLAILSLMSFQNAYAGTLTDAPNAGTGSNSYAPAFQSIKEIIVGASSDLYVIPEGPVHNPGGCTKTWGYALNRKSSGNNDKYDIFYASILASFHAGKKIRFYIKASKCVNDLPEIFFMRLAD